MVAKKLVWWVFSMFYVQVSVGCKISFPMGAIEFELEVKWLIDHYWSQYLKQNIHFNAKQKYDRIHQCKNM